MRGRATGSGVEANHGNGEKGASAIGTAPDVHEDSPASLHLLSGTFPNLRKFGLSSSA